jgi:hypothetical protein
VLDKCDLIQKQLGQQTDRDIGRGGRHGNNLE